VLSCRELGVFVDFFLARGQEVSRSGSLHMHHLRSSRVGVVGTGPISTSDSSVSRMEGLFEGRFVFGTIGVKLVQHFVFVVDRNLDLNGDSHLIISVNLLVKPF
jgi:hypothetical protein